MRTLLVLSLLCAAVIVACSAVFAADAYSLDITGISYDEECLTYCLQGLVNRESPRLFLDTAAIFGPGDKYWLGYLSERKGFRFKALSGLREAIRQFRPGLKGLILYDPAEDATRYLALTIAARRNLLPVTPAILKYETPILRSGGRWTEDDMSEPGLWHAAGATPEKCDQGMRVVHTDTGLPYGAVDRVVEIDLARTPLLVVTVSSCTANWALKVNEGTAVDAMVQPEGNATGVIRHDLREALKRPNGRITIRIFTVGAKSNVVVQRLRLLSAEGLPVPPQAGQEIDCFAGMPVVEDLRGRFSDDLAAYRWALDNLMPQCSKRLAFSAGHPHGDVALGGDPSITIGLDYPIAQKAFIFNLSPAEGPFDLGNHRFPGYPAQAKLFDEVMTRLDRPAGIYGWSEPEFLYTERVSRGGNFVMCSAASNTSFWAKVPARGDLRLPISPPRSKPLEAKFYLTFQTNEGDTPKILACLMSQAWISDKRGSVPIAWGIDPHIAEVFPALFEYYVTTAKPLDSFFAGCSGGGYCYPWHMPNLDAYARHVRRCVTAYGPNVVDVWESGLRLDQFQRFQSVLHVPCFTQQTCGAATNNWLPDGTPVLSADNTLYYYELDRKDPVGDLQKRIERVAAAHQPPFFIVIYGGLSPGIFDMVQGVQQRLPADKFEVIGADDMVALARQAGQFTANLDGLGVAPGGSIDLNLALRNPGGPAGAAGRVAWTLPAGWTAPEAGWDHGPVPAGQALEHRVRLTAAAQAGPAAITCTDLRTGAVRAAKVNVYAASQSLADFSAAGGWEQAGATLEVQNGVAKVTTPGPFASIRKTLEIDYDRDPIVEIDVRSVEGLWGLKVNDGALPVDIILQGDTATTGRQAYDLSRLVGWHGKRQTQIILFAIQPGKAVYVGDLRLHYRK
jgi:hypothetical protein